MKTTLHYIIAILLLSLNAAYVFAEGDTGPFEITDQGGASYTYNSDSNLLTISGGSLTITGDGNPVKAGIVIEGGSPVLLTIKDLHLQAAVPLTVKPDPGGSVQRLILRGTNILESTEEDSPGIKITCITSILGTGSLTTIGKGDGAGIDIIENKLIIDEGVFVVAIGGEGASSGITATTTYISHDSGLLIYGKKKAEGGFDQEYSELKGNLELNGNAEIPQGATVTIPADQSLTIPAGITLTNNGTITNNGTFTNNGNYEGTGTLFSTQPLTIGGKDGFDVSGNQATFSYDDVNKLLTIGGSGDVLIKGRNKAVNCGIVLAKDHGIVLTIKDLHIQAAAPLKVEKMKGGTLPSLTLQGTNILESTAYNSQGIEIEDKEFTINGPGSLTAIGGDIDGDNENGKGNGINVHGESTLYIDKNAFVVFINGKGAKTGLFVSAVKNTNGFLITGTQRNDGIITQDNPSILSVFTLGVDAEIPSWAGGTFKDGESLTIPSDFTLTNSGTITNNGTITNEGRLLNRGTLTGKAVIGNAPEHLITFNANYSTSPAVEERYIPQGKALPTDLFTRTDYTFVGWYDAADGGTAVTASTEPQTLYARWKANEKPVEPDPTPIYYSVYLPQVEGVTTNPGPGVHDVESWDNFRFYLTLDSAYSQSQPIVTTDRGETLQPRTSDGAYLVKYVRSDVEVFIDGIVQNPPPVANEAIAPADALAPQIWAEGSMLCIRMPEALPATPIAIYTINGRQHDRFASTPGLNRRQLPTGIYIVRVGETVRKVIVK